ncbi:dihydrolipoyl dehydrogenase [Tessaracoccus sp. MC1865]|uniref:dihydrolipoyl dehydrogenase n=1 Tax=Tessaracoccus sp. MC1865 TaxID=2760310 RepID=UPI0016048247|nr:dihydrolipoyl dehydrogenase [Tessaracoccus sp. MC1865]MBB1483661.1 dihydrolipoyl dehydrogenase [Tessaracoccus sp. MC1865]QTO36734.1 dihydrolipoyl dehydrogenase [Tessaracoccus sp. MC1865]
MTHPFDLAILGAGSAGYACALRAAQLGLRVALFDDTPVGGTCLHRGCIPAKAWLQAAKVRSTVAKADAFGIGATLGDTDVPALRRYVDGVIKPLHKGLAGLIAARGITLIQERGVVTRDDEGPGIDVGDAHYRARAVVVATGAAPITLGLPVDGERILTSDHALRLTSLPGSAIVLGGGVIGVEFASLWTDLGVKVTLVEALDRLLPGEEPAHSSILKAELMSRGIDVRLGAPLTDVEVGETVSGRVRDDQVRADVLLVAAGRRPATAGLRLAEAGVRIEDTGHVAVDQFFQTSTRGIFAAGDLVAGPQLAHRGYAHGLFLAERIAQLQGRHASRPTPPRDRDIPRITYSTPQVASVGLTAEQAGPDAQVVDYPLSGNGRSRILRAPGVRDSGRVRLVREPDGAIVGVHLIGDDVGELIGEGALLVGWQATPEDVAGIVHAHPTLGESIAEANWALAGRPLHMHV